MAEDPRPARTRQALVDAVTALLDAGVPADSIAIADLVRAAGVSRPTFYQHFGDLATLIRTAALARLETAFSRVPDDARGESWTVYARGTFRTLLSDLQAHAVFFLGALQGPRGHELAVEMGSFLADKLLNASPLGPIIRRRSDGCAPMDRARFLAAGTVWHVEQWLRNDATGPDPLDSAADRISTLLLSASGATDAEIAAVNAEAGLPTSRTDSRTPTE